MKDLLRHIPFLRYWNSTYERRLDDMAREIQELKEDLGKRLAKLEKIERIAANVARERAARPRNWTQFRAVAEGAEEPNARR